MSIEFLLTTLIIVAAPGTGVVYTLAAELSRGARAAVLAAFACTLGIMPDLVAALTGLAALLHASALAFMAATFLIFAVYGGLAAAMRDRVVGSPSVMAWMRSFAAAFVMLGARLAPAER